MEKYRPKTAVASLGDRVLRLFVTCGTGIAWFVFLWDLTLPALTAGLALGGLIWLCVRQFGKRITQKREKQLRRIIGGELALQKLLVQSPRHAAFQAALWIAPRYPVVMHKALDWGVTGTLNDQNVLVRLIAQHESLPISVQQVVECVRETHQRHMDRCLLCLTAPATREALLYASLCDPPITVIPRSDLIDLAGFCSPATDEDLSRIGKIKKTRRSAQEWLAVILDASRARRYLWYGLGLSALALTTGMMVYPFPAAVCLLLYAGCKYRQFRDRRSTARSTP